MRPGFGVYIPLGYPDPDTFYEVLDSLRGCVDFIEVGIPSRRPKYDGPFIRRAHRVLVDAGAPAGFDAYRELPERLPAPGIVMGYLEDIGPGRLGEAAAIAAGKGYASILLPDLAFDYPSMLHAYVSACRAAGLQPSFFASSKFPHRWLDYYAANNPLLVYLGLQPSTGVRLPISVCRNIRTARRLLGETYLLAGFSVRSGEDASSIIACGADGVVVGTRFMQVLVEDGVDEAVSYACMMRRAVRRVE